MKLRFTCGSPDDMGRKVLDGNVHMHDLHATLFYLLRRDRPKLTARRLGGDFILPMCEARRSEKFWLERWKLHGSSGRGSERRGPSFSGNLSNSGTADFFYGRWDLEMGEEFQFATGMFHQG